MKPRTVIILWTVAAALGIAAYFVKFHSTDANLTKTHLTSGEKILPDLAPQELTSVTLTQGEETTTITRDQNNLWTVNERNHYPANHELLRNLLGALGELQVTQGYPCSQDDYGRFGVAAESKEETDLGLRVTMTNAQGVALAEIFLGKYNGADRKTVGRFIRISGDDSGVYVAGETFPGVYADPPTWLQNAFIHIENIRSIEVSAPNDPDFKTWEVSKATSAARSQFKLTDLTDQETMRLTSTKGLRSLLAVTSFQDTLTPAEAKKTANPDATLKRQVKIQTFDGIRYTITFWPQKEKPITSAPAPDPESPLPPAQAAFLLTVDISADLTETRPKNPEEKPEDTKQLDAQFQMRQQSLKKQIALTQSFQGRIYQVGHTMLTPLLKSRSDFVSKK